MNNEILSKVYTNTKLCPHCKRLEMGIVLDNGLIRLNCGTLTNADLKWHTDKFGNKFSYSLPTKGTILDERGFHHG